MQVLLLNAEAKGVRESNCLLCVIPLQLRDGRGRRISAATRAPATRHWGEVEGYRQR